MSIVKIFAGLFSVIIYVFSYQAISQAGLAGVSQFFIDFDHLWRAQFNADFLMYISVSMGWAFYRETTMPARALCAFLMMFGGLFFFPYLLVAAIRSRGDVAVFFMGERARSKASNHAI